MWGWMPKHMIVGGIAQAVKVLSEPTFLLVINVAAHLKKGMPLDEWHTTSETETGQKLFDDSDLCL